MFALRLKHLLSFGVLFFHSQITFADPFSLDSLNTIRLQKLVDTFADDVIESAEDQNLELTETLASTDFDDLEDQSLEVRDVCGDIVEELGDYPAALSDEIISFVDSRPGYDTTAFTRDQAIVEVRKLAVVYVLTYRSGVTTATGQLLRTVWQARSRFGSSGATLKKLSAAERAILNIMTLFSGK